MPGLHTTQEMINRITELKLKGYQDIRIQEAIEKEFGRRIHRTTIKNVYSKELDNFDVSENMSCSAKDKIRLLENLIFNAVDTTTDYKCKLTTWVDMLETDIEAYYKEKSTSGINIGHIRNIQNALLMNATITNSGTDIFNKSMKTLINVAKLTNLSSSLEAHTHAIDRFDHIKQAEPRFEAITVIDNDVREQIQKWKKEGKIIDNMTI